MAIYHLNARGCSPSTGAGAVRKAAYQSGQALVEERSGQLCDYARKERVIDSNRKNESVFCAPVSFFGKSRVAENARIRGKA